MTNHDEGCGWCALDDLEARLKKADQELTNMATTASPTERIVHLKSKAEGVRLALSYLRETRK